MSMIKIAFVNVIIAKNNYWFIEYIFFFYGIITEKNRLLDRFPIECFFINGGGYGIELLELPDETSEIVTPHLVKPLAPGGAFLAKYSGIDGSHLWSESFGDISGDVGQGVAIDKNGQCGGNRFISIHRQLWRRPTDQCWLS